MSERALVGSDLVDLTDRDNLASFARPGYLERVCTPRERRALASSSEPSRRFFELFAAKEAAHKLLVKLGEEPGFSYQRIEIRADLASARYGGYEFALELDGSHDWVHAVAGVGAARTRREVAALADLGDAKDPSEATRLLLRRLVARVTGLSFDTLAIERRPLAGSWDGFAPPSLLASGEPTGIDVSLSHDGRFVAAALVVTRA